MDNITIAKNDLRELVTESVRDALNLELIKLRALALPFVSKKEQSEIEKILRRADRAVGKKINVTV